MKSTTVFTTYILVVGYLAMIVGASPQPSEPAPATKPVTQSSRYFTIEVVDDQTGRSVPLVELKTVTNVRYYTDSAGLVAIDDPIYLGQTVFFFVTSHGYEFPKDGFGMHGLRLDLKAGQTTRVKIKRINVAERLYRITGAGIYRDSVLLGRRTPIREPLINAQVAGQDSNQPVIYHGKIYYFWGDTNRLSYPLGHFGMSGATADLPGDGGLDPSVGIDLRYFTGPDGFARPTVPEPANLLRWVDAVTVLKDAEGRESMVARCLTLKSLDQPVANRLMMFNDEKNIFETVADIPVKAPLQPNGHPLFVESDGVHYIYYGDPFPNLRTRADLASFKDLSSYEGFTCLAPGARYDKSNLKLDRDEAGRVVWAWKKDTQPLARDQWMELTRSGKLKADELWFHPLDVQTQAPVKLVLASVNYNAYRKRWIAIASEIAGSTSMLGEIWYTEADKPEGPWRFARKIITHDHYSFYNPVHHPFYDQQGGRLIYFEGTYASTFSRSEDLTPLYDYNQIMYRLDLADPKLKLP